MALEDWLGWHAGNRVAHTQTMIDFCCSFEVAISICSVCEILLYLSLSLTLLMLLLLLLMLLHRDAYAGKRLLVWPVTCLSQSLHLVKNHRMYRLEMLAVPCSQRAQQQQQTTPTELKCWVCSVIPMNHRISRAKFHVTAVYPSFHRKTTVLYSHYTLQTKCYCCSTTTFPKTFAIAHQTNIDSIRKSIKNQIKMQAEILLIAGVCVSCVWRARNSKSRCSKTIIDDVLFLCWSAFVLFYLFFLFCILFAAVSKCKTMGDSWLPAKRIYWFSR